MLPFLRPCALEFKLALVTIGQFVIGAALLPLYRFATIVLTKNRRGQGISRANVFESGHGKPAKQSSAKSPHAIWRK